MCAVAEIKKRASKTPLMGSSTALVGTPPTTAVVGGYGGDIRAIGLLSLALAPEVFYRWVLVSMLLCNSQAYRG